MGVSMSLFKQAKTLFEASDHADEALLQHAPNPSFNTLFLNNFLVAAFSGPQSRPQLERATGSVVTLICNRGAVGSNPTAGTSEFNELSRR